jgi:hypothetical protein
MDEYTNTVCKCVHMCYRQDSLTKDRPILSSAGALRVGVTQFLITDTRWTGYLTVTCVHCEDGRCIGHCPSFLGLFSGDQLRMKLALRWQVLFPKCCVGETTGKEGQCPKQCWRLLQCLFIDFLCNKVDCVWNVMPQAKKPDFVSRRNGRVHLNRRGRYFSRLLAAEVCASAVVMLDTPCSEVVWRVLAAHSIHQFSLHFPSRASPCAITFQLDCTVNVCIFSLPLPLIFPFIQL